MPAFEDFFFDSSRGGQKLHARICRPDCAPVCVVQIAHGIAEHINRYDDFMCFLAANGIVAVGNDHLGHGQSFNKPEDQGFFAENDGWKFVVDDMASLRDIVRKEYPDLPYVFFGHSMGSFLTRTYLIRYPDRYDAAIISGTGHQPSIVALAGYLMANAAVKSKGAKTIGTSLNNVAFGSYCKQISNPRTPFDWLSCDEKTVDAYIADPLCGFIATNSLFRDMMQGIRFIINQKNIDSMNKDKPVYFMSGKEDPVGDYGKGVDKAYKAFCKAGIKNVSMRLYPEGRHEMLNETNKDAVYADILSWLKENVLEK
jgi:alpha-beta hydrolase superfamily lysophospholipase